MTHRECKQLDGLVEIANEDSTPLSEWECGFVESLDGRRDCDMTPKQADVFDKLVQKHIRGESR